MHFPEKEKYSMDDLLAVMKILRSPEGCPWDRVQTHASIRNNFIEETYEAVEAIDTENRDLLLEELGDVLFQVVFHAQMEQEADGFDFSDVVDGIVRKLIVRHPHVFGDVKVKDCGEVLQNWDAIKRKTKGRRTLADVLAAVSPALPALMRAQKLRRKAAEADGRTENAEQCCERVCAAARGLCALPDSADVPERMEKAGEMLFEAAGLAACSEVEAEQALAECCSGFVESYRDKETAALGAAGKGGSL